MATVEVPCTIGDIIYRLTQDQTAVCPPLQVEAIHIACNYTRTGKKQYSHVLAACTEYPWTVRTRIRFEEFGKTVFFSLAEAKAHTMDWDENHKMKPWKKKLYSTYGTLSK